MRLLENSRILIQKTLCKCYWHNYSIIIVDINLHFPVSNYWIVDQPALFCIRQKRSYNRFIPQKWLWKFFFSERFKQPTNFPIMFIYNYPIVKYVSNDLLRSSLPVTNKQKHTFYDLCLYKLNRWKNFKNPLRFIVHQRSMVLYSTDAGFCIKKNLMKIILKKNSDNIRNNKPYNMWMKMIKKYFVTTKCYAFMSKTWITACHYLFAFNQIFCLNIVWHFHVWWYKKKKL